MKMMSTHYQQLNKEIKYIAIQKYQSGSSAATYYNIPVEHCYILFDTINGDILSLIDINDVNNSVCIENELFKPIGRSADKLPTTEPIIINIINHVTSDFSGVKILEVDGCSVKLFDYATDIQDVVLTINRRIRENKISDILDY